MFNMDKVDKFLGITFKVMVVLYILVLASRNILRPDVYRTVSVPIEGCVAILVIYLLGRWTMEKLGFSQSGFMKPSVRTMVNTLGGISALIVLCVGIEYYFHAFPLTQQAINDLQASSDCKSALGSSIKISWFITGSIRTKGDEGSANLTIPVKGNKTAAELDVKGVRRDGSWHVVDLYLVVDGNKTIVQIPH